MIPQLFGFETFDDLHLDVLVPMLGQKWTIRPQG